MVIKNTAPNCVGTVLSKKIEAAPIGRLRLWFATFLHSVARNKGAMWMPEAHNTPANITNKLH